jgi:hypothetical protein
MIKTFKRYKKNRKNKSKRRRTRRRILNGGNNEKVKCSMCEKIVNKEDTLIPQKCLNKNGKSAHRICQDCWWNKFALEGISHECPGCVKGLPLTEYKKEQPIFIDLTED